MTAAERLDLDAIRARIDRAHDKVSALCSGKERWVMHIPAQPDHDADLVIGAALRDADALLRHVLDPCPHCGRTVNETDSASVTREAQP